MIDRLPFTDDGAFEPDRLQAFYTELHEGPATFYDAAADAYIVHRLVDAQHIMSGLDPHTNLPDPAISNKNTLDPMTTRMQLAANPGTLPGILKLLQYTTAATANATGNIHRNVKHAVYDYSDSRSLNRRAVEHNYGRVVTRAVAEVTHEFAVALDANGVADISADFIRPLATRVIGDVIGFDREEQAMIQQWSDAQTSLLGRKLSWSERATAVNGLASLAVASQRLIKARREDPQNDLASVLASDKHAFSDKLAGSTVMNLIAAGYATTYGTLQNSIRYLSTDAGRPHWERLVNPNYLNRLTPELIRLETGLVGWKRHSNAAITLADGSVIPGDRTVITLLGAANRDPAFDDPHNVVLGRPPNPSQISFGRGEHLCMGRELAVLEMSIALRALRSYFPDLRVAPDAVLRYEPDNLFRTLQSLPVSATVIRD